MRFFFKIMTYWNFYSILPTLNIALLHLHGELQKLVFKISFETKVTYAIEWASSNKDFGRDASPEPQNDHKSAKRTYSTNRDVILLFTTPAMEHENTDQCSH